MVLLLSGLRVRIQVSSTVFIICERPSLAEDSHIHAEAVLLAEAHNLVEVRSLAAPRLPRPIWKLASGAVSEGYVAARFTNAHIWKSGILLMIEGGVGRKRRKELC